MLPSGDTTKLSAGSTSHSLTRGGVTAPPITNRRPSWFYIQSLLFWVLLALLLLSAPSQAHNDTDTDQSTHWYDGYGYDGNGSTPQELCHYYATAIQNGEYEGVAPDGYGSTGISPVWKCTYDKSGIRYSWMLEMHCQYNKTYSAGITTDVGMNHCHVDPENLCAPFIATSITNYEDRQSTQIDPNINVNVCKLSANAQAEMNDHNDQAWQAIVDHCQEQEEDNEDPELFCLAQSSYVGAALPPNDESCQEYDLGFLGGLEHDYIGQSNVAQSVEDYEEACGVVDYSPWHLDTNSIDTCVAGNLIAFASISLTDPDDAGSINLQCVNECTVDPSVIASSDYDGTIYTIAGFGLTTGTMCTTDESGYIVQQASGSGSGSGGGGGGTVNFDDSNIVGSLSSVNATLVEGNQSLANIDSNIADFTEGEFVEPTLETAGFYTPVGDSFESIYSDTIAEMDNTVLVQQVKGIFSSDSASPGVCPQWTISVSWFTADINQFCNGTIPWSQIRWIMLASSYILGYQIIFGWGRS